MNNALRARVNKAVQAAQTSPALEIYGTIRYAWRGIDRKSAQPPATLVAARLAELIKQAPLALSLDQLTELSDHATTAGLPLWAAKEIADSAQRFGDFALPRTLRTAEGVYRCDVQPLTLRYTMYLGYVATPAYAALGRIDKAVRLSRRFLDRLCSRTYDCVLGAGGHSYPNDATTRLLTFAAPLNGLAVHWPSDGGSPAARRQVDLLLQRLIREWPLSDCMLIRAAALGVVTAVPSAARVFSSAASVASERHERELAAAFEFFSGRPELLRASGKRRLLRKRRRSEALVAR
ncbi:hypothetical protein [Lacipirellula limnantheis]|uniref:Uncharacterized protein n=1 Tax=Lacipirellula limnantheis TaxID=2528024 RepID=A0A517TTM5_9BACT|nr:hypothetical protein [Lacipirellula limnantheis]QDT71728.1 hypothetical protein I41_08880 [Lacipirellula limnantheis]